MMFGLADKSEGRQMGGNKYTRAIIFERDVLVRGEWYGSHRRYSDLGGDERCRGADGEDCYDSSQSLKSRRRGEGSCFSNISLNWNVVLPNLEELKLQVSLTDVA
jgi:hypothetical protein